jgi:hypothetical protein
MMKYCIQFYANIIPPTVANIRTFEGWRREAERQNPQILFCHPDVLMAQEDDVCVAEYPDNIAHYQVWCYPYVINLTPVPKMMV